MAEKNIVDFKCIPFRCTKNTEEFKMYACDVIGTSDDVKENSYGNYTITGNMHDLEIGVEYDVRAVEVYNSTYKYSYRVLSIERDVPSDLASSRLFLDEILTPSQTDVLLKVYPNIVDKVMNDDLDDIDLSLTKGIKEFTFNVIKRKIFENFSLSRMFKDFDGLIGFEVLRKLSNVYPSSQKIKDALTKDPYKCLCALSRVAFKTADGILLEIERNSRDMKNNGKDPILSFAEDLRTSKTRMMACIEFVLEENEKNGNTKLKLSKLKTETQKLVPKAMAMFKDSLKEMETIKILKDGNVSLLYTYEREAYVSKKILDAVEAPLVWNFEADKFKTTPEGDLTEEQYSLLEDFQKSSIHILKGYAGCGKTFSVQQLIKLLDANNKTYTIMAPTGRASKVIANHTNRSASTIHRGLSFNPTDGWGNNYKNQLLYDMVIVDEFSMADLELFYRLVDAIDFKRTKLLLIGDPAQLPSVSCGNVLHDMIESTAVSKTELTKVFRYGVGGLSTVATQIRNCEQYIPSDISKPVTIGEDKAFTFFPSAKQNIVKNCIALYKKLLTKYEPEDIMVLSSFNKGDYGTKVLNKYLQKVANQDNINKNNIKLSEKSDTTFYHKDIVIQCANNYKAEVFNGYLSDMPQIDKKQYEPIETFISNGDIGIIDDIHEKNRECKISYDDDIRYSKDDLLNLKLAYAISTHKSQGGQAKVVILLTPSSHQIMLNSNLIYVGVTRARLKCFQIGEPQTALKAIKKKENFNRKTNFIQLLKDKEESTFGYESFVSKHHKYEDEDFYN